MSGGGLNRLLKQQEQADWLGPALDAAAEGVMPEHWTRRMPYVRPSSAGGLCYREAQLHQLGHRPAVDAELAALWESGKDLEDRVARRYILAGVLEAPSVRLIVDADGSFTVEPDADMNDAPVIPDSTIWSGEIDLLVRHPDTGELVPVEVKKMHMMRQRKFPKGGPDPVATMAELFRVELKYATQFTQYLVRFHEHLGTSLTGAIHVEDEWGVYRIVWVRPSERQQREAFSVAVTAACATAEGSLLDPPFKRRSPTCRKCSRERLCYLLQDGDRDSHEHVKRALKQRQV